MDFLLLTFLATSCFLGKTTGEPQTKAGPSLVKASVGDDVLLKCTFTIDDGAAAADLSRLTVLWFHRGKQLAEFDNGVTVSKQGISLSQEELATGNASLLISKVATADSGKYRCYTVYMPEILIREVTLQVEDPSQPSEEDREDSLGYSDVLKELQQILRALEQLEAKLDGFVSSKTTPGCGSDAVTQQPSKL
ncbi:CD276 antigen-like [Hemicordylus capensis]|uniref:CD276 antigen-like n=1 Tax=Hemicordylus capensis TaxID=884348 RepID=UPI002303C427|nr:CD276 antigen-like [Hemicordylus capensis]